MWVQGTPLTEADVTLVGQAKKAGYFEGSNFLWYHDRDVQVQLGGSTWHQDSV